MLHEDSHNTKKKRILVLYAREITGPVIHVATALRVQRAVRMKHIRLKK